MNFFRNNEEMSIEARLADVNCFYVLNGFEVNLIFSAQLQISAVFIFFLDKVQSPANFKPRFLMRKCNSKNRLCFATAKAGDLVDRGKIFCFRSQPP